MSDRTPRRVGQLYLALAAALVLWVAVLAVRLPSRHVTTHYTLAWVGFDVGLALVLGATGVLAVRRSPRVVLPASAAAALLVTDAWFDVTTATSAGRPLAVLLAVVVELPLAGFSLRAAWRALDRAAR